MGMVTSRPWIASRMAVSAEISATVIRTRTKSSMRKNCRIAEDYIVPVETRLAASPDEFLRRVALVCPLVAAGVTGPSLLVHRDWNANVRRPVRDELIQLSVSDIE